MTEPIDAGEIRRAVHGTAHQIKAATLRDAHPKLESGTMIGKLIVAAWQS